MPTVSDTEICKVCGEEYWYEFDCRTLEYTKLTKCACDRLIDDAIDFLKQKGLYEEFMQFHKKREETRKPEA